MRPPDGPLRAVLDTNVLVSAFIRPKGIPAQIRVAGMEARFIIVLSDLLFQELRDVLARPRLVKTGNYTKDQAEEFLSLLALAADVIPGPERAPAVLAADPDDDWVLATAVEGNADAIVSGDAELLGLGKHAGIPIMLPADFLNSLKKRTP